MADDPCCRSFGGRISLTIDGERFPPTPADITVFPSNIEVTGEANHDGSAAYISKPVLFGAEFTLRQPCGIVWNDRMRRCSIDAHIIEDDNGRTHIFTGARLTGRPSYNASNGVVSGLKIEGDKYRELKDAA